jgi:hypothetical protein
MTFTLNFKHMTAQSVYPLLQEGLVCRVLPHHEFIKHPYDVTIIPGKGVIERHVWYSVTPTFNS